MKKNNKNKKRFIAGAIAILLAICMIVPTLLQITSFAATKPGYVTLTKISAPAYNKIKINWKKTSNVTHYKIYYRKTGTKKWIGVKTLSNKYSSYTHTSSSKRPIIVGQKYDYTVKGYNKNYKTYGKYNTKGLTTKTKPSTVKLSNALLAGDNVNISWNAAKGCDTYKVYRKTTNSKWNLISSLDSSVTSYVDRTPVKGTTNIYTVKSYYSKTKTYGNYDKLGLNIFVPKNTSTDKPNPSPEPNKPNKPIMVEHISVSPQEFSLPVGESIILTAHVSPSNATNKAVEWTNVEPDILKLEPMGNRAKITALKYGVGEIEVSAKDSGKGMDLLLIQTTLPEEQVAEVLCKEVFDLTNEYRVSKGLHPLEYHPKVQEVAMARAKELEIKYSHVRPDGTDSSTMTYEVGVSGSNGENIACGQITPKQVVDAWIASLGHENAIKSNSTHLGIGYHVGKDGRTYWVQTFIRTDIVEKKGTIIFDTKGGNGDKTVTLVYGQPVYFEDVCHPLNQVCSKKSECVPEPTKPGFKFLYWTDKYGNRLRMSGAVNKTVYAKWQAL